MKQFRIRFTISKQILFGRISAPHVIYVHICSYIYIVYSVDAIDILARGKPAWLGHGSRWINSICAIVVQRIVSTVSVELLILTNQAGPGGYVGLVVGCVLATV